MAVVTGTPGVAMIPLPLPAGAKRFAVIWLEDAFAVAIMPAKSSGMLAPVVLFMEGGMGSDMSEEC